MLCQNLLTPRTTRTRRIFSLHLARWFLTRVITKNRAYFPSFSLTPTTALRLPNHTNHPSVQHTPRFWNRILSLHCSHIPPLFIQMRFHVRSGVLKRSPAPKPKAMRRGSKALRAGAETLVLVWGCGVTHPSAGRVCVCPASVGAEDKRRPLALSAAIPRAAFTQLAFHDPLCFHTATCVSLMLGNTFQRQDCSRVNDR